MIYGGGQYLERMAQAFLWTLAIILLAWVLPFVIIYILDLVLGFVSLLTS